MLSGSSIVLAFALLAAPAEGTGPPVTMPELDAIVAAGNYQLIRREKIGRVLEATGVVRVLTQFGTYPVLDFEGSYLSVALRGLTDQNAGLAPGDRVKFRGMIVDEGYACLQVWTYQFEKLPSASNDEPRDSNDASASQPEAEAKAPDDPSKPPVDDDPAIPGEGRLTSITSTDLDAALDPKQALKVRNEFVGDLLEATGEVTKVGHWPLLTLPGGNWRIHLHGLPDDHGLVVGDRVKFRGLILDEAYQGLPVWTYRFEKLPVENPPAAEPAPAQAPAAPIDYSHLLDCSAPPSAK